MSNIQSAKARFWVGILWIESMVEDWQSRIETVLQIPATYIIHDQDTTFHGDPKSPHVHCMVAYGNTTTENAVKQMFNELSKPGMQCCNKVFRVRGVKYMDDYFLHATPQAQKEKKHLYSEKQRIRLNDWNTEKFNQIQITDKLSVVVELGEQICQHNITNYIDLYTHICSFYDLSYLEILISYSSHFDRMVKAQWIKSKKDKEE